MDFSRVDAREERKFVHCAMRSVPWCAVPLHEQQRNIPPLTVAPPFSDRPTPKLRLPLLLTNVLFNSPIPIDTYGCYVLVVLQHTV